MLENEFYSKQLKLKEVGAKGQERLKSAKVLIVGAGGLGHPAATYITAAGVGEISLIDYDRVEASNLNRQIHFSQKDLGKSKSRILAKKLAGQNPFINISSKEEKLSVSNANEILQKFDLIIDCTDNFQAKYLIHDVCYFLKKDLVQGGIYQYEGQVQVFSFSQNEFKGCLRCLWERIPESSSFQNCEEAGVIGATAGIIGSIQASEAIKSLLGIQQKELSTTLVNILNLEIQKIKWKASNNCKLCSKELTLNEIFHLNSMNDKYEVHKIPESKTEIIDIREREEIESTSDMDKTLINLPLSEFENWRASLNKTDSYIFVCQKGIRSLKLTKDLHKQGYKNCLSLSGGISNAIH